MLSALGQDVGRLKETPSIASSGLESLISGSETNPADCLVDLIPNTQKGIVILRDIPFRSICEHHLLPFVGTANLLYEPGKFLAGLGNLTSLVRCAARRLSIQERVTDQIADAIYTGLCARRVLVSLVARHTCILDEAGNTEVTTFAHRGIGDADIISFMTIIR